MTDTIRATELKDLPALSRFLTRIYKFSPTDHHADTQLLEWKYLRPRPKWEGSRSFVLERNAEIIAHCGVVPVTLHTPEGAQVNALTMTDWAADPAAPGVGIRLFRKLMEKASISFVVGGAPVTRLIIPRIGFKQQGEVVTYSAWLRPWSEFRTRRTFTLRSLLRLTHGLTHLASRPGSASALEYFAVKEFDQSLSALLSSAKRPWTFSERTIDDLNYWLKCPHLEMQGFLLKCGDKMVGYFILCTAEWEARLLDLLVDSENPSDWRAACAAVIEAARLQPKACRVRAQASIPLLSEALSRNGYWIQYRDATMIHDPSNLLEGAFPVDLQLLDGDSGI